MQQSNVLVREGVGCIFIGLLKFFNIGYLLSGASLGVLPAERIARLKTTIVR